MRVDLWNKQDKEEQGEMSYEILVICCILALIAVLFNIRALAENTYTELKVTVGGLVIFTAFRYITLIAYGDSPDYSLLNTLRYFYFASSIGITMTTVSAIWYVIPYYREKIAYPYFLACFIPWIIFYLYVIIKQPTNIVQGSQFGYRLVLSGRFSFYLSVAQASFIIIAVLICVAGIIKYKHLQIRTQLLIIILAQCLLALDGISFNLEHLQVIPPFTITEAFALMATYYAFAKTVRSIHALKNE